MTLLGSTAAVVLAGTLLAGAPLQAKLTAPGHSPKIKTHWNYTLSVTQGGKPAAARITAEIVDPIGGHHLVEFGKSTKLIKDYAIEGVFRDYIIWPPESRGIPLRLRFTITAGKAKTTVLYAVVPHG